MVVFMQSISMQNALNTFLYSLSSIAVNVLEFDLFLRNETPSNSLVVVEEISSFIYLFIYILVIFRFSQIFSTLQEMEGCLSGIITYIKWSKSCQQY